VSIIRAYRSQDEFVKRMEKNIDEHYVYFFNDRASDRWYIIQIKKLVYSMILILENLYSIL
jgi:hypothetical protein